MIDTSHDLQPLMCSKASFGMIARTTAPTTSPSKRAPITAILLRLTAPDCPTLAVRALGILALAGALLQGAAVAAAGERPLGSPSLDERRAIVRVAPGVTWTRIVRGGGPWRVHVLTIDRSALGGRLTGVLSNRRIEGRERASAMARRARAVAGVNDGYFAEDGDPVGALAMGGRLLSEPVDGRSGLIVPLDPALPARVATLSFGGAVVSGGRERLVDGVERLRGSIPACGGRGGDAPTERPNSALTCTDPSELVLLSPRYGPSTGTSGGVEAVVRSGTVGELESRGNAAIPAGGLVLSGSADAAGFLTEATPPGSRPEVRLGLLRAAPSCLLPGSSSSSAVGRGSSAEGESRSPHGPRASRRSRRPASSARSWPPATRGPSRECDATVASCL
jgi:hypothetical protein